MSKKDLCEMLGVEITKPLREQRGFHTIYQASRELGVNPGLIHYHMGKEMRIGDVLYTVSKLNKKTGKSSASPTQMRSTSHSVRT